MIESQFAAWLAAYKQAWEERDPEAAARLFTRDAVYVERPFAEPMTGREAIRRYWANGPQTAQRDVQFRFEVVAVKEAEGVARWWAEFTRVPSGKQVELDGIFRCFFRPGSGQWPCERLEEWWHRRERPADAANG
jgi:uncharacterized protein (TIGR02246 family)